jgi:uncharacterized protein YqiB (DUF1249 family)
MTNAFHLREIDPTSEAEIDLVARRMQATLVEVEREEMGLSLRSVPWLRDRVRWHLDTLMALTITADERFRFSIA